MFLNYHTYHMSETITSLHEFDKRRYVIFIVAPCILILTQFIHQQMRIY